MVKIVKNVTISEVRKINILDEFPKSRKFSVRLLHLNPTVKSSELEDFRNFENT